MNIGIITSGNTNNKLYYEVNQKFEYYEPLQQIFGNGVAKTKKKPSDKDAEAAAPATAPTTSAGPEMDEALKAIG